MQKSRAPTVDFDDYSPLRYDFRNYVSIGRYSNWKEVSFMVTDLYAPLKLEKEQAQ